MNDPRKWYKKKRFLIPVGLVLGLFTLAAVSNTNPQPLVSPAQQTITKLEQNTPPSDNVVEPFEAAKETANTPAPTEVKAEETPKTTSTPSSSSASNLSNDNHYQNVDGNTIHSPAKTEDNSIPPGATARCNNGSYSFSAHHQGSCSHNGGVAEFYN